MHPVIAATLAHNIERAIYDVSRILLYPVLIAALFCLGWAIVEVGWFLYELYLRLRYRDLDALEIRSAQGARRVRQGPAAARLQIPAGEQLLHRRGAVPVRSHP